MPTRLQYTFCADVLTVTEPPHLSKLLPRRDLEQVLLRAGEHGFSRSGFQFFITDILGKQDPAALTYADRTIVFVRLQQADAEQYNRKSQTERGEGNP